MPIYEYRCCNCNGTSEALVRADTPVSCPHCGSLSVDKLISAPFISSGQTARQATLAAAEGSVVPLRPALKEAHVDVDDIRVHVKRAEPVPDLMSAARARRGL